MKENLTEMVFILDRSGSMSRLTKDTIDGYNSLIKKQKEEDGEARVTTVLFDNFYDVLYENKDINTIEELTDKDYYARGMTALLDAIGKTINMVGHRLNMTPEEERPSKVVVVITTDGQENSSCEFTKSQIKEMIELQQNTYNWTFMFLGANIDSMKEASSMGIDTDYVRNYSANKAGTDSLYCSVSNSMMSFRKAGSKKIEKNSEEYNKIMKDLNEIE